MTDSRSVLSVCFAQTTLKTRNPSTACAILKRPSTTDGFSPKLVLLATGVSFSGYSALFYYSIERMNLGLYSSTLPFPLVVLLILSSSVEAALSVNLIVSAIRTYLIAAGLSGSAVTFAAGLTVASCACNVPLLASLLYFLGANTLQVSAVLVFLADYQLPIALALVLANGLLSYLTFRRLVLLGGRLAPDRELK